MISETIRNCIYVHVYILGYNYTPGIKFRRHCHYQLYYLAITCNAIPGAPLLRTKLSMESFTPTELFSYTKVQQTVKGEARNVSQSRSDRDLRKKEKTKNKSRVQLAFHRDYCGACISSRTQGSPLLSVCPSHLMCESAQVRQNN